MSLMALTTSKILAGPMVANRANGSEQCGIISSFCKSTQQNGLYSNFHRIELRRPGCGYLLSAKLMLSSEALWRISVKPCTYNVNQETSFVCHSRGTHNAEAKECVRNSDDCTVRAQIGDEENTSIYSTQGLGGIGKFVDNDAKFVNERARNDLVLLSRGLMRLNDRACQDVAVLGLGVLKLDARAREDTEKIDNGVKEKAERLHHITTILKEIAESKLLSVANKHWNDGALEADLRRADFLAKRRAMEDAYTALEFVKNIHDMMVTKMYKLPIRRNSDSSSANDIRSVMLEKNGKTADFFPGEISSSSINSIKEVYLSMASALSEADGIDYTDPEELELLVSALIDLDAMDGKSSVSLLAECSSSPDDSTRQALANALSSAPSMWTLGNAGMGALQRLAEDDSPAIAAAASRTIDELKKQWEIEEGDSLRFMMNDKPWKDTDLTDDEEDDTDVKKD
ncbi:senescence-associated protein AAF, chlorolplastic-like isoform X2 [Papaver somniferum]|uniref:senescence-associated protein AAF, chlorolplastic-like isoform X2 n=1 Tax=Papaver somniferum TaxID=3469 RepID=UPI000E6FF494|nr:senescence-associated protein AAF, chlorolplastic-like isoform X2 [Papaver somniferum]